MIIPSGVTWFEDEEYIGSVVSLDNSSWKLEVKIREHEYYETEEDTTVCGLDCEARGVFIYSKVSGDGPQQEILKIRLQYAWLLLQYISRCLRAAANMDYRIPWFKTVDEPADVRAKQATSELTYSYKSEIEALSILTKANCSSTPALLASGSDKQGAGPGVPGGYIFYILMEKLPGVVPNIWGPGMGQQELADLRMSFKNA
ncbi:hypothetical protein F5884DRAFT_828068 [Xylogone sp. PMI_703]|nr:hypothetical protein F5884DRAFT_828068 [Xylogone sp. PMI_703]